MKYTDFGEYFKILRIKNHEVLVDASKFLNVSCALISSVECGKRSIPSDWYEKIALHYKLNQKERNELKEVIERSVKAVKIDIDSVNETKKDVAIQLQRSFDKLDENTANEILEILRRNS